jgi:hypothetical protein
VRVTAIPAVPRRRAHVGRLLCRGVCCQVLALPVGAALHTVRAASLPVLRWADEGIANVATLDPDSIGDQTARLAMGFIFEGLVRQGPNLTVVVVVPDQSLVRASTS